MRKLLLPGFVLALIGVYAGRDLWRNAKGVAPSTFGMQRIGDKVFVDAAMDVRTRKLFLASIDTARGLTQAAFGSLLAAPTIIGCSTEACFQDFGEKHPKSVAYHHWWVLVLRP